MQITFLLDQNALLTEAKRFKEAHAAINIGLMYFPRHPQLVSYFSKIPNQYDNAFFGDAYDSSFRSAVAMLGSLNQALEFKTVVDIGAGVGAWSRAAIELNKEVLSIDGNWVQEIPGKFELLKYSFQNLNEPINTDSIYDLAICLEVAEHLSPVRSEGLISDLCGLAPVVMFGAALPRQGGAGHINCRPHSFWINLFAENNYKAIDFFRPQFWYDGQVGPWYSQNTYLFVKNERASEFSNFHTPSLVDVYHPKVVLDSPMCLEDHSKGTIDPGAIY